MSQERRWSVEREQKSWERNIASIQNKEKIKSTLDQAEARLQEKRQITLIAMERKR